MLLISNKFWMGGEGGESEGEKRGGRVGGGELKGLEGLDCGVGGPERLSYFLHLSGPSRAIKLLYAPAPPSVWALKPP
jgi:hypothetical protein